MCFKVLFFLLSLAWAVHNPPWTNDTNPDVSKFRVDSIPGGPPLPPSWAGLIPIPGAETGNSLFFWLFHAQDMAYDDNFIIWLNGGPGCSSLMGTFAENGPISFVGNTTNLTSNPYSWTKLGNVLYIDQPVGTAFATSTRNPTYNIERVTSDFHAWLTAFYKQFPHLIKKKLHIMGESFSGIYIPYFAAKILKEHDSLPLDLQSISLGDPVIGNHAAMTDVPAAAYMGSHAATLKVPQDILEAFSDADDTCGFTSVLKQAEQYPPRGPIIIPGNPEGLNFKRDVPGLTVRDLDSMGQCDTHPTTPAAVLSSILNSTCYGACATFSTAADYAETHLAATNKCFSLYNIEYNCDTIDPRVLMTEYLSRADVQDALHIPSSSGQGGGPYRFKACNQRIIDEFSKPVNLATPPAYSIIPDLLTKNKVAVNIYHGELDMLIDHIGIQWVLQNMTWNGLQGFQERPTKVFGGGRIGPDGTVAEPAGIWTEERGLKYHLFYNAGHAVPLDRPKEMFNYVRDFVVRAA